MLEWIYCEVIFEGFPVTRIFVLGGPILDPLIMVATTSTPPWSYRISLASFSTLCKLRCAREPLGAFQTIPKPPQPLIS